MPDLNDLFGFRPDRPTHPDMAKLSDVVLQHDGKTEDSDFSIPEYLSTTINPDVMIYMAKQRAFRMAGPGASDEMMSLVMSMFMDGFMVGVNWQHRNQETVIADLLNRWVSTATSLIWETSGSIGPDIAVLHDEATAIAAAAGVKWQAPGDDTDN